MLQVSVASGSYTTSKLLLLEDLEDFLPRPDTGSPGKAVNIRFFFRIFAGKGVFVLFSDRIFMCTVCMCRTLLSARHGISARRDVTVPNTLVSWQTLVCL